MKILIDIVLVGSGILIGYCFREWIHREEIAALEAAKAAFFAAELKLKEALVKGDGALRSEVRTAIESFAKHF